MEGGAVKLFFTNLPRLLLAEFSSTVQIED